MKTIFDLFKTINCAKVMSNKIDYSDYVPLDLSKTNEALKSQNIDTATDYVIFIQNYLNKNKAKIAYGGYNETRNLYKRSTVFNDLESEERNIHIGLDLWINEQAPVYATLDGKIHSFQNNQSLGDYGPTIILEHNIEGFTFHTLYGHLSLESLENKTVGDYITKGFQIGNLGLPPINGDYAPHLHFQIILAMEDKKGDYPGVSSEKNRAYYLENCPDPELLLKIK
ncbi:MAG: peptidoglycan DD-metalloendopeptidase family protein [Flavobacterium sp.]|nr:peptidoglycan DD-metalloendopeptidase family protein [Flavobacterium sp.]